LTLYIVVSFGDVITDYLSNNYRRAATVWCMYYWLLIETIDIM